MTTHFGFADPVDYIYRTTAEIWEGRGIDRIKRYYHPDAIVRTPMGVTHGSDVVIAATKATLQEFPDRRLLGEDVMIAGEDDAFYSSHRIISPMTHAGDGQFGPASGKRVFARTIADVLVRQDRVCEEWLVRDHGAILRQLGQTPQQAARARLASDPDAARVFTPEIDPPADYDGHMSEAAHAQGYAATLQGLWASDLGRISADYHDAIHMELPGGGRAHGRDAATRFWMGLAAAIPDARFSVDHLIGRDDPGRPLRAAARWTINGTHSGHGAFGAPTGARVHILGISHAEFNAGRIHREWVLIDELAIALQIAGKEG